MLVLSRKVGESIMIDDNIEVVITEIRGDKVKVGVVAPRSVAVHRSEIHEKIAANALREPTPEPDSSPAPNKAGNQAQPAVTLQEATAAA